MKMNCEITVTDEKPELVPKYVHRCIHQGNVFYGTV